MLSIYKLDSSGQAVGYYQQGDYYTAEKNQYSLWLGKGSEILALQGPVDFKVFQALLEGYLPNGEVMTQVKKGEYHRPGYDLTFSAPKSVSILALVAGQEEILQAHREAVQETLAVIEAQYAACRRKENGILRIERTKNFTIAAFEHSDSRAGDPLLHTHTVLMNITQNAQGKWLTLYGDELYTNKLLNGLEYRSRLANKLMQMGLELEFFDKGLFEIKAVDRRLIDFWFFSRICGSLEAPLTLQAGDIKLFSNILSF